MVSYKKALGATLFRRDGEFIIVKGKELFKLNEVGARIFELCNESNDKNDIIDKLSKYYNICPKEIEEDIKYFIDEMVNMQIIKAIS